MYLANHRSWADAFVDSWVVGGRAVSLSRNGFAVAFPALVSSMVAIRAIVRFNRLEVAKDVEKFNSYLDASIASAHAPSIMVQPEGHRNLGSASLPLKRGMLRYAHSRKLPVQVCITAYKEEVLNERLHSVHFGRTLVTGLSEVVDTPQYADFEEFMKTVQATWDAQWVRVHAAPREGLPEWTPSFPPKAYPPRQVARQFLTVVVWLLVMLGVLGLCMAALVWVASLGAAGVWVVRGLAAYTAASFLVAFMPPAGSREKQLEAAKQD